ncbi:MAG: hypothetical protein QMD92_08535 [bacterium]|nr:hypothetical protein [bacterium]
MALIFILLVEYSYFAEGLIVDDFCKKYFPFRSLRTKGRLLKLSDSEVITMEIVGEYLNYKTDKEIYEYFKRHWTTLFPNMPDRSNSIRQSANLWYIKQHLFDYLKL